MKLVINLKQSGISVVGVPNNEPELKKYHNYSVFGVVKQLS
jgi:hypothetical protein